MPGCSVKKQRYAKRGASGEEPFAIPKWRIKLISSWRIISPSTAQQGVRHLDGSKAVPFISVASHAGLPCHVSSMLTTVTRLGIMEMRVDTIRLYRAGKSG